MPSLQYECPHFIFPLLPSPHSMLPPQPFTYPTWNHVVSSKKVQENYLKIAHKQRVNEVTENIFTTFFSMCSNTAGIFKRY